MTRDSSPPDAIRSTAAGGVVRFAEKRNSTRSRPPLRQRAAVDDNRLETCVGHSQPHERGDDLPGKGRSCLFARAVQLGGQQFGLVAGGSDLGLQGGQFLVGVRNGVELCGIAVSERNQFALVGRTVLLAKRIERIETVVHLLQPFGVGLDALAVLGERRGDVF